MSSHLRKASMLCLGLSSLCYNLKSTSRQKANMITGLASFASLLSGLTVLHGLLPNVCRQLFHIFCPAFLLCTAGKQAWHQLLHYSQRQTLTVTDSSQKRTHWKGLGVFTEYKQQPKNSPQKGEPPEQLWRPRGTKRQSHQGTDSWMNEFRPCGVLQDSHFWRRCLA